MQLNLKPGDIIERDGILLKIVYVSKAGCKAIRCGHAKAYDNSLDPFFDNGWRLARKKLDAA